MKNRVFISLLSFFALLASLSLSGCQTDGKSTESSSGQASEMLTVMTSFYPVYISTINITRGIPSVEVINMTSAQTGCLHDYQLKPADLTNLDKADVFVVNGAGMEEFLGDVAKRRPGLDIVDASRGIDLIKGADNVANPHVWVSMSNVMQQVRNIADGLALADPDNAIAYKSNASIYLSNLSELRKAAVEDLSTLKTRDFVTFHEAFEYMADEFDLNIISVIESEPDTSPTAKELEKTISALNKSTSKVIFTEPQYSDKIAQMIADETGSRIYQLDPVVTGESNLNAMNDYINTMKKNIMTLKKALG
ncbi:MAG: metal ABC transporter substrate-binding protein [Saccharofermentanales bacterium]